MKKPKVIFVLMFVIFSSQIVLAKKFPEVKDINGFTPDGQATLNPAMASNTDDSGDPTKGEIGWLGTMAGVYNKSREAVKSVYDEIQYWKGLGATYGMMKNWFKDQKDKFKGIKRTLGRLREDGASVFKNLDGKDWFETMLNYMESPLNYANFYVNPLASTVEQIDGVVYGSFKELDEVFSHAEKYTTALGNSNLSGFLMPTTDEIYDKFDEIIYTSSQIPEDWKKRVISDENYKKFTSDGKQFVSLTPEESAKERERQRKLQEDFFEKNSKKLTSVDDFPETKIVEMMKMLTASATGNSAMYYSWAIDGLNELQTGMEDVDKKFANGEMNNIIDLQILAAKFEIEMINANNKRILHNLEALKIHNAMLGFEIWKHNESKSVDESFISEALTLGSIARDAQRDFEAKEKARQEEEKKQSNKNNLGDSL